MMYFIRVLLTVTDVQELLNVVTVFLTALRVGFPFSFFFERDYLFSVLAFESSATSKTRHKIKHPANAVHSRTKPVSASLHAVFFFKYKSTIQFRIKYIFSQKARFKHNSQCLFLHTMKKLIP